MGSHGIHARVWPYRARHVPCLGMVASSTIMSHRTHFWLRLVGLTLILAAEFGPRAWAARAGSAPPAPAPMAAAGDAR